MVALSGKKTRTGELRYLNQPRPIHVLTDTRGWPKSVVVGRKAMPVERTHDRWRIDDGWWRQKVCRMYWELEMEDGRLMTIFRDEIAGQWFEQWYGAA